GSPGQDVRRSGDRAHRCRSDALNEGFDLWVLRKATIVRCSDENDEIGGRENCKGCGHCADQPSDQIPDESRRYNNGAGSDHCDRNGVYELAFREPLKLDYNSTVQERNNCQPAAKDESTSLQEKQGKCCHSSGVRYAVNPGKKWIQATKKYQRCRSCRQTRGSLDYHCDKTAQDEEPDNFGLGPSCCDCQNSENGPE